jgi:hypothetical protein
MSENEIPTEVKDFVFHSIDSAEQLDIILLLHSYEDRAVTVKDISDVLRSSPNSIETRLKKLIELRLITSENKSESQKFRFNFENAQAVHLVSSLAEVYKSHRYGILEIIFSPLKKSRDFADAFKLSNPKDPKGGRNG